MAPSISSSRHSHSPYLFNSSSSTHRKKKGKSSLNPNRRCFILISIFFISAFIFRVASHWDSSSSLYYNRPNHLQTMTRHHPNNVRSKNQKNILYEFSSLQNEMTVEEARGFDAILILGGGAPTSLSAPPVYVQNRCDAAVKVAEIAANGADDWSEEGVARVIPNILCLSAGTAHVPQAMSLDGLPIWEATASAAYILERYPNFPEEKIFAESTSYDTISNAFFARTSHTDVAGWRNILIVTSQFHMDRTKSIFDWVFQAPGLDGIMPESLYRLSYLATENIGLSDEALLSRMEHEKKGAASVKRLSVQYPSLKDIWLFLVSKHDFYSASKLVAKTKKANATPLNGINSVLKESYGGGSK